MNVSVRVKQNIPGVLVLVVVVVVVVVVIHHRSCLDPSHSLFFRSLVVSDNKWIWFILLVDTQPTIIDTFFVLSKKNDRTSFLLLLLQSFPTNQKRLCLLLLQALIECDFFHFMSRPAIAATGPSQNSLSWIANPDL
jgi:hypothetical protein